VYITKLMSRRQAFLLFAAEHPAAIANLFIGIRR
jgi:hypothetical protein